jgi:signal transduction histidine kinase
MGGDVGVDSPPGDGTVVWFRLPARLEQSSPVS